MHSVSQIEVRVELCSFSIACGVIPVCFEQPAVHVVSGMEHDHNAVIIKQMILFQFC